MFFHIKKIPSIPAQDVRADDILGPQETQNPFIVFN